MLNLLDLGAGPNTGTGDTIRNGSLKINSNFQELYDTLELSGEGNGEVVFLSKTQTISNKTIDSSTITNTNIPSITASNISASNITNSSIELSVNNDEANNEVTEIKNVSGYILVKRNQVTLDSGDSFTSNLKGKYEIMDSVDPLISADCYFNGSNINIITVSDDISETISDSDKIVITVDGSDIKITNKFSTQKEIIIFQK